MNKFIEDENPIINVYIRDSIDKDKYVDLLWGIEEEGIPYQVVIFEQYNSKELASKASDASKLNVGIGIDHENIVLHYEKLSPYDPLFIIDFNSHSFVLRELGETAARLVKKVPFKFVHLK